MLRRREDPRDGKEGDREETLELPVVRAMRLGRRGERGRVVDGPGKDG